MSNYLIIRDWDSIYTCVKTKLCVLIPIWYFFSKNVHFLINMTWRLSKVTEFIVIFCLYIFSMKDTERAIVI